jgi:hypothetical protein
MYPREQMRRIGDTIAAKAGIIAEMSSDYVISPVI